MKKLFLLVLLIVGSCAFSAEPAQRTQTRPSFPFIEKKDLDLPSYKGYATLTLENSKIKLREKFSVDIRFTNKSGGEDFYNPYYNRLFPLPICLAIYDSDKRYIGDLLHWQGGSRATVGYSSWSFIAGDSYVGTFMSFAAGYVPGTEFGVMNHLLPPGEYYLQVIFYKSFIMANPSQQLDSDAKAWLGKFYKNFDRTELFRSNAVKVQFIK